MAIREIISIPDPRLKLTSEPVGTITPSIHTLVKDMLDTMYDAPGIGLAAIQIAVAKRVVVIDLARKDEDRAPMVLVNPEIIAVSQDLATYEEGCLSIPEYYEEVKRPATCRVRYRDLDDTVVELDCDGLLATCVQHEIDHLNGLLFIDHISRLKRSLVVKKFAKAAKKG